MQEPKFIVQYGGRDIEFPFGSQVYIYHTAILHDITDIDMILEMVNLVQYCYINDAERTPLGALADFIIEFWDEYKDKPRSTILEEFYGYL